MINKNKLALILTTALISNQVSAFNFGIIEESLVKLEYASCVKLKIWTSGFDKKVCLYDIDLDGKADLRKEIYTNSNNGTIVSENLYYKPKYKNQANKLNLFSIEMDETKIKDTDKLYKKMRTN